MPAARIASFDVALALVFATASPAIAAPKWWCAQSRHFELYSCSDRDSVERLATALETMADILGRAGLGQRGTARPVTVVIGFADQRSYKPHQPTIEGRRQDSAGRASHNPFGNWIGYAEFDDRGRMVVQHEYTHTIVNQVFRHVPLALNEGFADYLSTFRADENGAEFGHPIPWHRAAIREMDLMPMDELFAIDGISLAALNTDRGALFYAEAWALVHYLLRADATGGRFTQFMRATADGTPARTALAKYYPGENWDKIPATLKGYVETQVFTVHQIPLRGSAAKAEFVLRPASAADALAEIGIWRLYVLGQDTTLTRQLFQDAIRQGSVDGVAEAGLGELSRMGGRTEDALVHFRSVTRLEHPSPRALTIAGMGMLLSEPTDRAPQQQLFAESHATLVRSVALDSTDAAALGWYGRAAMAAGAVDDVVVSELRRATEANPSDESLASAYSIALAGTGHTAEAKAAAEGSRALKRDQAARHETMSAIDTLSALNSAVDEYDAGVDAARAGRAAEAREHFLAAERLAGDDEMRVECRQAVASIDSILVDEQARATFERAMRAGQAGNFAAAQAGFDSTKAMTTIEMLRAAAENGSHNAEAALEIHRGAAAAKKGAWSEAVAALQRAATLAREPQLKAHAEQLLAEAKRSANAARGTPARKP